MATNSDQNTERQFYIDWLRIFLFTTCFLMIPGMFILPALSVPEYSIVGNTLNELGAQSAPNAWIMNLIFIMLGISSLIAGWKYFEGFLFHRLILVLFAASLILMAFFNHAPVSPDISYNKMEDGWNAYFTVTASISFIILSFSTSFITERQRDRMMSLTVGISAVFLSVLMSEAHQLAGILQRVQFIMSFGWIIYSFK
jgi:hypothetical membrane protein